MSATGKGSLRFSAVSCWPTAASHAPRKRTLRERPRTKTIRPTGSYIAKLEPEQIREWGLPGTPGDYYEDHLVPLCAGGHPDDPHNLWPQRIRGQWTDKIKDQLESSVCRQLCRRDLSPEQARAIFLEGDWTKAYLEYFELK